MTINEHLSEFAGKPVKDWMEDVKGFDPIKTAYRISLTFEEADEKHLTWADKFRVFMGQDGVEKLTHLVVGAWENSMESESAAKIVNALVDARDALPNLKAIFLGDFVMEESEISWIEQTNVLPLLQAYPQLETFAVRGSNHLVIGKLQHPGIKSFIIQDGGLPLAVLKDVLQAELPNLEHLELWLGDKNYGWDGTVDDLKPLLAGEIFPKLRYLGLRDSQIADEIAVAVAEAPILNRIKVLDLSLGTLTDEGAAALLKSPSVRRLQELDLHHHYCSDKVIDQFKKLGIKVDVSDKKKPDKWKGEVSRYVAVSE